MSKAYRELQSVELVKSSDYQKNPNLIVYYVAIAAVFMLIPDLTVIMKLLMVIIPLALAGVAFAVTVERVQEIRSGEEDDLSKY